MTKRGSMSTCMVAMLLGMVWALPIRAEAALSTKMLNNVVIGSDIYVVTFTEDGDSTTTFDQVFGNGVIPALTFTTEADARAAAAGIIARADPINFIYESACWVDPPNCENGFILPYAVEGTGSGDLINYLVGRSDDPFFATGVYGPYDRERGLPLVSPFATFELQIAEPTTLALLGIGLAGLVATRRRKQ